MTDLPEVLTSTTGVLLSGIVGSTAYGLAGAESDVDRLGVFAVSPSWLLSLHPPLDKQLSIVQHNPDVTLHDVGKFLRLAHAGNPTILELLWLPPHRFDLMTDLGAQLVDLGPRLLSRARVRGSYLGFATQQLRALQWGKVPQDRRRKHGLHLARLLLQVQGLHRTGRIVVELPDEARAEVLSIGEQCDAGRFDGAEKLMAVTEELLSAPRSAIPAHADIAAADRWLLKVRVRMLRQEIGSAAG